MYFEALRLIQERKAKAAEQKAVAGPLLQAEAAAGLEDELPSVPMTPTQVFGRCPIAERDLMWTARPDLWLSSARTSAGVTRADAARVTERMARLCEMSDYAPLDASSVGAHLEMFRSGGHDDLE
ncbi:hypothetical protein DYB32_007201 [Aphanomyces invadans]|uniref:Uncharacterized protein n=1 Tax=Aphanomyces invadans TaxID=157072 RepID=A0A3R6YVH4_9STRA|nr:hypothetical protein DYB32_007201 [Aphanomyces invadans]